MKKHIFFNSDDKPENMGISQLTDDIDVFISERSAILKDASYTTTKLTFTKPDGNTGYAVITNVPDDFKNC